jgi:hypothetical protein
LEKCPATGNSLAAYLTHTDERNEPGLKDSLVVGASCGPVLTDSDLNVVHGNRGLLTALDAEQLAPQLADAVLNDGC